jgi:predicted MPP superfamily phosphohydrolase
MSRRESLWGISALVHAYIGWRLLPPLSAWPLAWAPLLLLLSCSTVLIPKGLMGRRPRSPGSGAVLSWTAFLTMGLLSSLFVLTVLRDAILLLVALVGLSWPQVSVSRQLETGSAVAVPLAALLITLLGLANARRTAAIVSVDVPIAGLPETLHGFTIAQISDIHIGPTIRAPYLRAIVAAVNGLNADMVALTGDLVDGSVRELAEHVQPLVELSSRHGTFFVTGNHEYYSGAEAWIEQLRRLHVRVLMNEHVVLRHDDADVVVAGVPDFTAHYFHPSHRSDPQAALKGAPADAAVQLLLAHQPRSAEAAAKAGFHLQLSGHTHGGQFWPWNHFVRLQQPFVAGLHRVQRMWVYISRGTGYWGPPKRFGAPSEITRIRLVRPLAGATL